MTPNPIDVSQLDPRVAMATSVNAESESENAAEPQALKITAASSNPKMFTLPWSEPLASWPQDLLANLPRGISRHVVRFVHVGDEVYAMKEITRQMAEREYENLRRLQKLELPSVTPIAVVTGRHDLNGEPLEAILVTKHLKFSLPYRALFARNLRPDTAERLIDALAVLMVRLHLAGFYWGDVSLSNVLFLRDADAFTAFLVDAETGDLQINLTEGQREYDIDLARTNIIGELMDLSYGKLLPGDVDEIEIGNRLVDRYHSLWSALTDTDKFKPDEMWKIEKRVNKLNELGFDVDELEMKTTEDGKRVLVRPRVVDAGYASRKLLRLTGLDVQENQARRLLNDLDAYRASTWREGEDLEIYTSGATNILKYPELSDSGNASELLNAFEEKDQLVSLVTENLAEDEEQTGIQVYIGNEAPIQTMKDCSVVTATYELGEGVKGTIGIIGPKRMDYENVMSNLKNLKAQLDGILDRRKK